MGIPEAQLNTWSAQGAAQQSRDTYATIKAALEDANAPYATHEHSSFLQGSYGNDTNVRGRDSDVDVVMRLDNRFLYDLEAVGEPGSTAFHQAFPNVDYGYDDFKRDVTAWMFQKFGVDVEPGTKAIRIKGRNNRRDADVLPCIRFRRYYNFKSASEQSYAEGICFFASDGTKIINYPILHKDNCTVKHQATNSYFKAMVRIIKNMRNRMVEEGLLEEGLAPSYYLEGLMYNVPNNSFGTSYSQTFINSMNWLVKTDRTKLVCANEQYYLLRPNSPVCWQEEKCKAFLDATIDYWNNW
ncbi:Hypothetical protein RG1141_CH23800 [Neorhizobium galegae bv. officinalis bv. officinalis str. HAMBI 1141]|jgi:hypothetical protein|uniref:cGAS/DncV-like nucleotidyltransferase C-terminal helical domain-containing protein n=1 Tax=Neorhizobium galegae bv. officinalis bv. officinalis str. HAMBI 1141 TaxID=1028801 RepID=A0A068T8D5_NEOGA|nr:nucleotidyltransferase [Neorhizobium galegae]CDN54718.1 Hypothetical protein RG1141_CH23800 [Neorhizobium galegae bv. officinalis bv. officinalis str. HAMBI 1141]